MRIPKLRKHSSGQARVTLGGRTFYCGRFGTSEAEAKYKRLVAEYFANGGLEHRADGHGDLTVAEMLVTYMKWAKSEYESSPGELDRIRRIIRTVVGTYADTLASSFGYQQYEVIRNSLVASGVGRKYVNESMKRLVRIFRWSGARGLVPVSVPQALEMVEPLKRGRTSAPEPEKVESVDCAVIEKTIEHLPEVVADMVRFQLLVGCRPGEVCQIKPEMVDRSGEIWHISLDLHKTTHFGKDRVILVHSMAQEILTPYLLRPPERHCFSPVDSERKRLQARHDNRKTPGKYGNRPGTNRVKKPKRAPGEAYDTCSYRRAINRACDRAFRPPEDLNKDAREVWQRKHRWAPNQLRHTFATIVRSALGLEAAQLLLSHSDADTTLIYAERDKRKAIEAAKQVGDLVSHFTAS